MLLNVSHDFEMIWEKNCSPTHLIFHRTKNQVRRQIFLKIVTNICKHNLQFNVFTYLYMLFAFIFFIWKLYHWVCLLVYRSFRSCNSYSYSATRVALNKFPDSKRDSNFNESETMALLLGTNWFSHTILVQSVSKYYARFWNDF